MAKLFTLMALGLVLGLSAVSVVAPQAAIAIGETNGSDGDANGGGAGDD